MRRADDHHVSPLATLIEQVIARERADGNDLNYSDIARRGTDLTRGNVARYASKPLDRPIPLEKREGLALGLRVHPVRVDRAVAESLGLMLEASFDYDYRTDPALTSADVAKIDAYIQGIRDQKRRGRANNQ